jgi:hypothetical protein
MISDLTEDSNKQLNEIRKSIQDLNEQISKDIEILGRGKDRNVKDETLNKLNKKQSGKHHQ